MRSFEERRPCLAQNCSACKQRQGCRSPLGLTRGEHDETRPAAAIPSTLPHVGVRRTPWCVIASTLEPLYA